MTLVATNQYLMSMAYHGVHERSVQLADARDAEGPITVRHKAGALVGVAPQNLRGCMRHVIHRSAAQLERQAHVGSLQQDHGRIGAGPQGLLDQAQVGDLRGPPGGTGLSTSMRVQPPIASDSGKNVSATADTASCIHSILLLQKQTGTASLEGIHPKV